MDEEGRIETEYIYGSAKIAKIEYSVDKSAEPDAYNDSLADSTSYKTRFFTTDLVGSTTLVTDENGKTISMSRYDPFGSFIYHKSIDGFDMQLGFGNKETDELTGLQYFNARFYDAFTGRFMSEDPVQEGWNPYVYCANNPFYYTDPTGMYTFSSSDVLSALIKKSGGNFHGWKDWREAADDIYDENGNKVDPGTLFDKDGNWIGNQNGRKSLEGLTLRDRDRPEEDPGAREAQRQADEDRDNDDAQLVLEREERRLAGKAHYEERLNDIQNSNETDPSVAASKRINENTNKHLNSVYENTKNNVGGDTGRTLGPPNEAATGRHSLYHAVRYTQSLQASGDPNAMNIEPDPFAVAVIDAVGNFISGLVELFHSDPDYNVYKQEYDTGYQASINRLNSITTISSVIIGYAANAARISLKIGNGRLTIVEGGKYSASEINAANQVAGQGNNVVLRPPTGVGRTSDLLVNKIPYDIYTPTTSNASRIISAIAKKNSQARGIVLDLSKTSVTRSELGNVLKRVQGAGAKNINDVIILGGN